MYKNLFFTLLIAVGMFSVNNWYQGNMDASYERGKKAGKYSNQKIAYSQPIAAQREWLSKMGDSMPKLILSSAKSFINDL